MFNVMTVTAEGESFTAPKRFFIDCPLDVEMHEPEYRRIEIPRELAKYIKRLQSENSRLKGIIKESEVVGKYAPATKFYDGECVNLRPTRDTLEQIIPQRDAVIAELIGDSFVFYTECKSPEKSKKLTDFARWIKKMPKEGEEVCDTWKNVNKELPDRSTMVTDFKPVLVVNDNNVQWALFNKKQVSFLDAKWCDITSQVTHWMNLPKAPQEGKE